MRRIGILMLAVFVCFVSTAWPQAEPQWWYHKIVTFDVPGAGTAAGQGTLPIGIVQGNWIMGTYIDGNGVYHGFLRAPDGAITKFDVPGAGTAAGQGTVEVFGMNPELEITGTSLDASNVYHVFLRTRHDKFTTFDAPGAGSGAFQGTGSLSMNPAGVIAGEYFAGDGSDHGFLRTPDGTFITFDPPDAGKGLSQGTYPAIFSGINPAGAAVGEYLDTNYVWHAYLRAHDGTITEFDAPGASNGGGTGTLAINPKGDISGWYYDANGTFHGFVRSPDGTIAEFDAPGAGTGSGQGTTACVFFACLGASTRLP
jgi:hypothetical protein